MTISVGTCSVGTELLLGDQVDTNAVWLSQRVGELGGRVIAQVSAGDDLDQLVDALRWLVDRSDVVIVGGGLGPTSDDLTREAVAALAGVELRQDDELVEYLVQRFAGMGRRLPPSNLKQALIPIGGQPFAPLGTAPGFGLDIARGASAPAGAGMTLLCALPGVPWELQQMFTDNVAARLLARSGGGASITRTIHVTGGGESAIAELLGAVERRVADAADVELSYLASAGAVRVRLTARGPDVDSARATAQPFVDEAVTALGSAVSGLDDQKIDELLVRELAERGQTVGFAESATGGGLTARLVAVPGASAVVRGALVTYATETKATVAGVDAALLAQHGPVSVEVTEALAVRARAVFCADWGVAVTGVAGPEPQDGREVGTVTAAICGPDDTITSATGQYPGDRASIQQRLAAMALELLRRRLLGDSQGAGDAQRESRG